MLYGSSPGAHRPVFPGNYRIVLENYTWDAVAGKYLEYLKSIGVK